MIRKFNYTGRKRIARSCAAISLTLEKNGLFSFAADIDLEGMDLPRQAEVFVEAYHRTSYMRFPFGNVGNLIRPDNRLLDQIEPGSLPLFRVKVVLNGRILASADKIIPRSPEEEPKDKLCLLPVEFRDLGDLVWRLDFSNDRPVLELNSRIDAVRETARSDPGFFSLIYPEVIRQVLRRIVLHEKYADAECDGDDWQSHWLRFAQSLPGIDRPPSADYLTSFQDREDWVEEAVAGFCIKWRVRDRFLQSSGRADW